MLSCQEFFSVACLRRYVPVLRPFFCDEETSSLCKYSTFAKLCEHSFSVRPFSSPLNRPRDIATEIDQYRSGHLFMIIPCYTKGRRCGCSILMLYLTDGYLAIGFYGKEPLGGLVLYQDLAE